MVNAVDPEITPSNVEETLAALPTDMVPVPELVVIVPAPDSDSTVKIIPLAMVTVAPEFTVSDFIVVLAVTAGILTVPELMTTSVVEVGTSPVFQLAAVDHAVLVPPTQVVCALTDKTISCMMTNSMKARFNLPDLTMLLTILIHAYPNY